MRARSLKLQHGRNNVGKKSYRATDHIRAFEKIAGQQKRVPVEVDAEKREYEYARAN
jgi:hypothetical protein